MARKMGVSFNQGTAHLGCRPTKRAALGAALFSASSSKPYDGGPTSLTFVAYNAGPTPRRASGWIATSHPSGQSIEAVVDWIERIPFTETRAYVQRVDGELPASTRCAAFRRMDMWAILTSGRRQLTLTVAAGLSAMKRPMSEPQAPFAEHFLLHRGWGCGCMPANMARPPAGRLLPFICPATAP